jgi:WD40 repeat protein
MFSKQESQHNNFVNQIRYNSDGSLLASVSTDKKLVLYDGKTGTLLKSK